MNYSDPNRLDRVEALVEANSQQIEANSQQIAQLAERSDASRQLIEANSQQIAQIAQTTQFLTSAQLELARSIDVLTRRIDRQTELINRRVTNCKFFA